MPEKLRPVPPFYLKSTYPILLQLGPENTTFRPRWNCRVDQLSHRVSVLKQLIVQVSEDLEAKDNRRRSLATDWSEVTTGLVTAQQVR